MFKRHYNQLRDKVPEFAIPTLENDTSTNYKIRDGVVYYALEYDNKWPPMEEDHAPGWRDCSSFLWSDDRECIKALGIINRMQEVVDDYNKRISREDENLRNANIRKKLWTTSEKI